MILYNQGVAYWREMCAFNAHKNLPGMALHTSEKMQELLNHTTSAAVRGRIQGFLARHGPR